MDHESFRASRAATATTSGCMIDEHWIGGTVVISASGVVDMLTSPDLAARITAAIDNNPTAIIVDLSAVDFLASAGMSVLVAARDRASGRSGFAVVADGPATSRPLTLVGLADVIGLHATVDEARAALGE